MINDFILLLLGIVLIMQAFRWHYLKIHEIAIQLAICVGCLVFGYSALLEVSLAEINGFISSSSHLQSLSVVLSLEICGLIWLSLFDENSSDYILVLFKKGSAIMPNFSFVIGGCYLCWRSLFIAGDYGFELKITATGTAWIVGSVIFMFLCKKYIGSKLVEELRGLFVLMYFLGLCVLYAWHENSVSAFEVEISIWDILILIASSLTMVSAGWGYYNYIKKRIWK
ncbi:hypothetical protein [Aureibacter tunicatorum]|uniref:Uncharacterized protein n=1 Tax=Aureibacter tunicatorum TaxID=866807 RepID=A0AAE4BVF3_9BACT|nr:hypothetical protein [Aureibacter tunicatorum]MDR6242035.1 hypothetical protein [Aureibacter tunicatorum]BDD07121.1 hypothetical protein AUTU_46040 [Aureibacter tunicatorum]